MSNDGGDFVFCHAVIFSVLQMITQGRIGDSRCHQGNDGDDTFCLDVNRFLVPDFAKQHIVIEVGEHRCKFTELCPACGLCNFIAHMVSSLGNNDNPFISVRIKV